MEIKIFYSKDWADYELVDTGEGEKLERFGKYLFVRPYEDAFWDKNPKELGWQKADGKFWSSKTGAKGGWKLEEDVASPVGYGRGMKKWEMGYRGIKFFASPTPFRHLGFFPEQAYHWDLIEKKIKENSFPASPIKFLNLFGYTGVASLFALRAGAEVTHVDASKQSLAWAKENQMLSGLEKLPMRIIEDDAMKFIEREIKRGHKYDCIMMDPPKFGRGPKGEIWKLEEKLPKLLKNARKILSDKPLLVILTSYATESSALSLGYTLEHMMEGIPGKVETGELCVWEKSNARPVPLANTAIWQSLEK